MNKQPIRIPYEEGDYLVHTARNGFSCCDPTCPCNTGEQFIEAVESMPIEEVRANFTTLQSMALSIEAKESEQAK